MPPTIHVFEDNQAVATAFAEWLIEYLSGRSKVTVALSGGSTPKLLFKLLAKHYADKINWGKVHFFWGDERCVPPESEESNFGVTHELLFRHVDIPMANINRIRGENDPEEEAVRYSELITENVKTDHGLPVFDLIMLGMGTDGHTASIFPHEKELITSDSICAVATHPDSGQKRITLTGKAINRAKQIAFLVTGMSKKDKIREILGKEGEWFHYPAAHIEPLSGKLDWFLDEAAAASLPTEENRR